MKTGTVRELLTEYKETAPGFDALRLGFSLAIMLWHTVMICYGRFGDTYAAVWSHPLVQPFLRAILPMFFFLGGFLVTGSALRLKSVKTFLIFRVFRIVPALLVEVCFSAIIIGGLLTSLSVRQYYSDPGFFTYFWNIVGFVHFQLPGVFTAHPSDVVNVNLWTLPPDFEGYAIMAVLLLTGMVYERKYFLIIFGSASILLLMLLPNIHWGAIDAPFVHPKLLIYSFFMGTGCYLYADRIPIKKSLMLLSVLGLVFFESRYTTLPGILCACYLTLCIGFIDLRKIPLIRRGDYSYGVYLYGFPIEQTVWHLAPMAREWWSLYLIAMPVTIAFSVFSWHVIEKPLLHLRHHFGATRKSDKADIPSRAKI